VYQIQSRFRPPLSVETWFDFPVIAASNDVLYIAANLFDNSGGYRRSIAILAKKSAMLVGGELQAEDVRSFVTLEGSPYSLYPAHVSDEAGQPSVVLISNGIGSSGSSSIDVYEFAGSSFQSTTARQSTVAVPSFQPPSFSPQLGSNIVLSCFDQRGAGSAWIDGSLHYVYSVALPGRLSGITYLVLQRASGQWRVARSRVISRPNSNIAYPSLAPIRVADSTQALLAYLYAGAQDYPGIACRLVNSQLALAEEYPVRVGDGPVTFQAQYEFSRWADYITIVPNTSTALPSAWLFAPYGGRTGVWNNLLAQIDIHEPMSSMRLANKGDVRSDLALRTTIGSDGKVTLVFTSSHEAIATVTAYDVVGRLIHPPVASTVVAGANELHMAFGNQPPGVYFLVVRCSTGEAARTAFLRN
jgi:hypothetical protein